MAQDKHQHRYLVTSYKHQSEQSYTFGPFDTLTMADQFARRLPETKWDKPLISVLNDPSTAGTGDEMELPEW